MWKFHTNNIKIHENYCKYSWCNYKIKPIKKKDNFSHNLYILN